MIFFEGQTRNLMFMSVRPQRNVWPYGLLQIQLQTDQKTLSALRKLPHKIIYTLCTNKLNKLLVRAKHIHVIVCIDMHPPGSTMSYGWIWF